MMRQSPFSVSFQGAVKHVDIFSVSNIAKKWCAIYNSSHAYYTLWSFVQNEDFFPFFLFSFSGNVIFFKSYEVCLLFFLFSTSSWGFCKKKYVCMTINHIWRSLILHQNSNLSQSKIKWTSGTYIYSISLFFSQESVDCIQYISFVCCSLLTTLHLLPSQTSRISFRFHAIYGTVWNH